MAPNLPDWLRGSDEWTKIRPLWDGPQNDKIGGGAGSADLVVPVSEAATSAADTADTPRPRAEASVDPVDPVDPVDSDYLVWHWVTAHYAPACNAPGPGQRRSASQLYRRVARHALTQAAAAAQRCGDTTVDTCIDTRSAVGLFPAMAQGTARRVLLDGICMIRTLLGLGLDSESFASASGSPGFDLLGSKRRRMHHISSGRPATPAGAAYRSEGGHPSLNTSSSAHRGGAQASSFNSWNVDVDTGDSGAALRDTCEQLLRSDSDAIGFPLQRRSTAAIRIALLSDASCSIGTSGHSRWMSPAEVIRLVEALEADIPLDHPCIAAGTLAACLFEGGGGTSGDERKGDGRGLGGGSLSRLLADALDACQGAVER